MTKKVVPVNLSEVTQLTQDTSTLHSRACKNVYKQDIRFHLCLCNIHLD